MLKPSESELKGLEYGMGEREDSEERRKSARRNRERGRLGHPGAKAVVVASRHLSRFIALLTLFGRSCLALFMFNLLFSFSP